MDIQVNLHLLIYLTNIYININYKGGTYIMYLKANESTYMLTESYNKPYMQVSNSVLPLTTVSTIGGGAIQLNIDNNTYRPMTYGPCSSTWYTSATNSEGMYDTTALTEQVTTSTEYLTEESTRDMLINYKGSRRYTYNDNGAKQYSTSYTSLNGTISSINSTYTYSTSSYTGAYVKVTLTYSRITVYAPRNSLSYTLSYNNTQSGTAANTYFPILKFNNTSTLLNYDYQGTISRYSITSSYNNGILYYNEKFTFYGAENGYAWNTYSEQLITLATGTVYTNTTGTIYHTAESTTAYTGKSSSIESTSSSWYTSNEDGSGLYNTTALTVESTTGTSYLTIENTRAMELSILITQTESAYRYYQNFSVSSNTTWNGKILSFTSRTRTSKSSTGGYPNNTQLTTITYIENGISNTVDKISQTLYDTYYNTKSNTSTINYCGFTYISVNEATSTSYWYTYSITDAENTNYYWYSTTYISSSNNNDVIYCTNITTYRRRYLGDSDITSGTYYRKQQVSLTTGTAYTQTTGTSYLTSEVTTAYSGISSYSIVNSGWS